MRFVRYAFLFLVLVAQALGRNGSITLVSSSDARGTVTVERLNACLQQLLHEWKLDDKEAPRIIVFHVSKKAAQSAFVDDDFVRRNSSADQKNSYYEVWLVGEPNLRAYVLAVQNVLETHFGMTVSDEQRKTVMTRVMRVQEATISVYEGK